MKLLLLVLSFLLTLNYIKATQDTDGVYFVTSFPWYNEPNPDNIGITLNFFNTAGIKNGVTISYWLENLSIQKNYSLTIDPNSAINTNLLFRNVVKNYLDLSSQNTMISDPRIIITSQYPMKVISRIYNKVTGLGDAEMIPSSNIAHTRANQIIHIYGSDDTDRSVNYQNDGAATVYHDINGIFYKKYDLTIKRQLGASQNIIINPSDSREHSFSIYSNQKIYVVGGVGRVNLIATGTTPGAGTINSITDYAMMHFYPLHYFDCTYAFFLGKEDRRMLTSDYTKSVYITPPRSNGCENYLPISLYNQLTPTTPISMTLTNFVASTLTMKPYSQNGASSQLTYVPWIRFGGSRGTSLATQTQLFTSFLHYVPETSQWVSGNTNFVTFSPNSFVEVYADSTITAQSFTLDGIFVDGTQIKSSSNIAFFGGKYNVFTINVKNAGFHVLQVKQTGTYVVYVIGDNVQGLSGSYGYVAGYNINTLKKYPSVSGTISPPVSTTKSDPNSQVDYPLKYGDVVNDKIDITAKVVQIPDPRIFITSTYSIKLISRIYNTATGIGDSEMVPSTAVVDRNYLVALPKANSNAGQIIHILNTGENNTNVKINHYIDGTYADSYQLSPQKVPGQLQSAIVIIADYLRHDISIFADSDIFVVGAVVAFVGLGDQRVITSEFTKQIFVAAPPAVCRNRIPIYGYDEKSDHISHTVYLDPLTSLPATLTANGQEATASHYTNVPWSRFGGVRTMNKPMNNFKCCEYIKMPVLFSDAEYAQKAKTAVWVSLVVSILSYLYMVTGSCQRTYRDTCEPYDTSSSLILGINVFIIVVIPINFGGYNKPSLGRYRGFIITAVLLFFPVSVSLYEECAYRFIYKSEFFSYSRIIQMALHCLSLGLYIWLMIRAYAAIKKFKKNSPKVNNQLLDINVLLT
uniref:IgGFc_binding domain-containing protein n=1 Tax=Rhabditophanes sp. KR3021 TaxID=114890 RepID=A0AC35UES3_9BILA